MKAHVGLLLALPLAMTSTALGAAPVIGSPTGGPTANKNVTIVVDEAAGTVSVNGAITASIGNGADGVPLYPTGGNFVLAGDIYYFEPPTTSTFSDMIRIYASAGAYGDTFSVWSDKTPGEVGDNDPYDAVFPANVPNVNSVAVTETQTYKTADLDPAQTGGSYQFKSDTDAPEPASLAVLSCGVLVMVRRRR